MDTPPDVDESAQDYRQVVLGSVVRVVVGRRILRAIKESGEPDTLVRIGSCLPALVVHKWSDELLNVRIWFNTGECELFAPVIDYSPARALTAGLPGEIDAKHDTWHWAVDPANTYY